MWTMLVMSLAALCRVLSVLLSVLKQWTLVENLPCALPLTLRRFLEGRAACSVRWHRGVACEIFRAPGHGFPASCSLERMWPQGFCFESERSCTSQSKVSKNRAECATGSVPWAEDAGPSLSLAQNPSTARQRQQQEVASPRHEDGCPLPFSL